MNEGRTSKLGWVALFAALFGALAIVASLVLMALSHDKRPSAAYDSMASITSSVMFLGMVLQVGAVVGGFVALSQSGTRKVAPGLAIGCGGLPFLFMAFGVVFVMLTGGV